ncbi:MAG TPA: DUF932 domain-containing protein [Chroococcidiopsis sp.]
MSTQTWHRGTAIEVTPGLPVTQQLIQAGLDWTVELAPAEFFVGDNHYRTAFQVAYRSDNHAVFDVYLKRKPWQNVEIVETFNRFCDEADLPITHLGSMDRGRIIYAAAKLPKTIAPAQATNDQTEAYLMLEDSHGNGHGLQVWIYTNRLICTNGMKRPVQSAQDVTDLITGDALRSRSIKNNLQIISHASEFNPDKVKGILHNAIATLELEQHQVTKLADTSIDTAEASLQLIKAFGDPTKPIDEQPRIVQTCLRLFGGQAKGSELMSAYNTAYGLLHAVTEYYNHHAVKRGSSSQQFQSILSGNRGKQMAKFERQLVSCYR